MGIVSLKHSSNLYWLGRYAERVYTTLDTFFDYYDSTLDKDKQSYKDFLKRLEIEDKFSDYESFLNEFLYGTDCFSISSTFRLAYDNALVLKNMIGSEALAYLELARNVFHSHKDTKNFRLAFMPVIDYLLSYWGCIDDHLTFG
ncbi:MAG: alpha-E domain-containing protein, partial [Fibromonadales bacterium]|nr:alpha-E domain-containing protein [Fibromonadales bacterium]